MAAKDKKEKEKEYIAVSHGYDWYIMGSLTEIREAIIEHVEGNAIDEDDWDYEVYEIACQLQVEMEKEVNVEIKHANCCTDD